MFARLKYFGLALFLTLFAACDSAETFTGECQINDDCPIGAFCKAGLCACRSDEACDRGEICNSQGVCQAQSGCRRNEECKDPATTFCDVASGTCIQKTACGAAVHCPPGSVCSEGVGQCVQGCQDDADCPLYGICENAQPGIPGTCLRDICRDSSFCPFGWECNGGTCRQASDPYLCRGCDPREDEDISCGGNGRCIVNTSCDVNVDPSCEQYYCATNCDLANPECANGYGCNGLVVVFGKCTPGRNSDCCTALDRERCCPDGEFCDVEDQISCAGGEGDQLGFCTCLNDLDCNGGQNAPRCLPISKTCLLGGDDCQRDSDCPYYHCVNGGCLAGSVCGLSEGLTCEETRP